MRFKQGTLFYLLYLGPVNPAANKTAIEKYRAANHPG